MSNIIKDNKKKIIIIILVILEIISIFLVYKSFISKSKISNLSTKEENNVNKKRFSMYKENDNGEYEEYTESNLFPIGYILNLDKSVCLDSNDKEVKGILSRSGDSVIVTSNKPVFCYLYFDKGTSISLTVSTDGVENTLPTYNHYQETLTCDNGTTSYFSTKYQRLEISQVSNANTVCNLNYTSDTNTYTLLKTKVESDNPTNNNGYRYSGKQPNNFVWFNNELWRIIGSIPVVSKKGTLDIFENRVKIIRAESIGALAYNSSASNTTWGSNTLYKLLNNYYYGKKNVTGKSPCLGYSTTGYALCNYTIIGISSDSNDYYSKMILDAYMNVGTVNSTDITISAAYTKEVSALTSSKTKIGLMTSSDYGYATSNITYSSVTLAALNNYEQNNWLSGQGYEWTMTPYDTTLVLNVYNGGYLYHDTAHIGNIVRPVVYLNSNVYIISGKGTESNPYILGV